MINNFLKYTLITIFLIKISSAYGDTSTDIEEAMQSMCNQKEFSGSILIANDKKIIFKNACGLSSRSFDVPNNLNTKFNLGSVGKLFTSVAIAQLVQKGKNFLINSYLQNNS